MDDQLRVALNNLRPSDWDAFQDFASAFLLSDFPALRPIGGTNDKGRDAVLFEPDPQQQAEVVLQYSLVEDWKGKINKTVARLGEKGIGCSLLIYATSRDIGSSSDEIERELRDKGIALSLRDREWWVIRAGRNQGTRHACDQLKTRVLGRMLQAPGGSRDGDLSREEVETGLFYLELHVRDADGGRSLTRVSFESLVLSALSETDAENRKSGSEISAEIVAEFPSHEKGRVEGLVAAALKRLKAAQRITISSSDDSYALHYAERQRLAELATRRELEMEALDRDLADHLGSAAETLEYPEDQIKKPLVVGVVRKVLDQIAAEYGNAFASAVTQNSVDVPRVEVYDLVERILINDQKTLSSLKMKQVDTFNLVTETVTQTLLSPANGVARYLHDLSEAYTLRAFLRETPDVQEVVDKLFGRGELVLDTSVLLPVFVETLLPEEQQSYTNLLRGARSAGMSLYCTQGCCNEIATHLRNSRYAAEIGHRWNGALPMVLERWRALHLDHDFGAFIGDFLGEDPEADVEDFLAHSLGIERRDLEADMDREFDMHVRSRITELWRERKRTPTHSDAEDLLLAHDVEMYLGVLALRRGQPASIFGHEAWWVTLETSSSALRRNAREENIELPSDPVMHPNFLSHLLALGPARRKLTKDERGTLPFLVSDSSSPWSVPGLASVAEEIRQEFVGRPEYFLRRKLRERINVVKQGRGPLTEGEVSFS